MVSTRLGDLLLESGAITEDQLAAAVERQREDKGLLGEHLVSLGFVSEDDISRCLALQLGVDFYELSDEFRLDREDVKMVPEAIARKYTLIPKRGDNASTLTLIMSDPVDIEAIDAVRSLTNLEIHKAVATEAAIGRAIDKFYRDEAHIEHSLQDLADIDEIDEDILTDELQVDNDQLRDLANDAPVVRFVNLVLMQAIRDRASDIHFEPGETVVTVRLRVDGVLRVVHPPPPKSLYRGIVTRIKILSDMDIAERRLPLDGRFKFNAQGRTIDVRVSSLPEVHGEKVVLRILDRASLVVDMRDIGMEADMQESFQRVLSMPNGIVLLTGPTGSGKTTTLYGALSYLRSSETNIQTVEDPVEYQLDGINQMLVRSRIGLDFASALRAILRQDPDIIMIGEIRDAETSRIAMRASLTGHLVLSTLHTNDAPSAFSRLTDIGIEPYLIAATVKCVIAQRLVRLICEKCKTKVTPDASVLNLVRPVCANVDAWTFYEGSGCHDCANTGYRGRRAVFGYIEVNDAIRELILRGAGEVEYRQRASELGIESLLENGLKKVEAGVTTLSEALSVSPDTDLAAAAY